MVNNPNAATTCGCGSSFFFYLVTGLTAVRGSLSALQVVTINACQTWMAARGVNAADATAVHRALQFGQ